MSETPLDRLQRFYDLGGRIVLHGDVVYFQIENNDTEVETLTDAIRQDGVNLNQNLYWFETYVRLATLGSRPCHICGCRLAWRSIHGPVLCACCHPPEDSRMVASVLYVGDVDRWKM